MSIEPNISKPNSQKLLAVLTTSHLINDFYIVILPFLLPTLITEFDLSFFQAGLLTVSTSFFSGIIQPFVGSLADIYHKHKTIILLGFSAFIIGLLIASISTTFSGLLVAFFVYGLGQATFHAQSTNLITDAFPNTRGKSMGVHGIGGALGNFSSPLVATALITAFSWRRATTFLIIPAIFVIIFLWFNLNKPAKVKSTAKRMPFITPKLILLAFNLGLIFMVYSGFLTFLPTYLVLEGHSLNQAGTISSIMLLVGVISQPAGGYIFDKFGGRVLIALSSTLLAMGVYLLTIETGAPIIVFIVLIGAAATFTFPVSLAMGSKIAKPDSVGASVGFIFGVSGVLGSFTPAITGYAADTFGLQTSFRLLVIIAILSIITSFFLPKKNMEAAI